MSDQAPRAVQLSLDVNLRDDSTFQNYYIGDPETGCHNGLVVASLRNIAQGRETMSHLIWGGQGAGLTHLLHAVCHEAGANGFSARYLPMQDMMENNNPSLALDGIEDFRLVCIDGLDLVCGDPDWELALFHLFNKLRDRGHALVLGSHVSPASLPVALADLKSRLLGSIVYHVAGLNDDQKQAALQMRADARGMNMPEEVAKYILSRSSRNMNDLFFLLNRLDSVSMQQHRKLTIPFVKEILAS